MLSVATCVVNTWNLWLVHFVAARASLFTDLRSMLLTNLPLIPFFFFELVVIKFVQLLNLWKHHDFLATERVDGHMRRISTVMVSGWTVSAFAAFSTFQPCHFSQLFPTFSTIPTFSPITLPKRLQRPQQRRAVRQHATRWTWKGSAKHDAVRHAHEDETTKKIILRPPLHTDTPPTRTRRTWPSPQQRAMRPEQAKSGQRTEAYTTCPRNWDEHVLLCVRMWKLDHAPCAKQTHGTPHLDTSYELKLRIQIRDDSWLSFSSVFPHGSLSPAPSIASSLLQVITHL